MSKSNKLNCIIVDDEPLALSILATHISKIKSLHLIQECSNAMEAFEAMHKNKIDLLFLDINMPVISGLSFLRSLKEPPAVILTTAYTEYALEGFELDAIDYLLKPISFERFNKAVNKVLANKNIDKVTTILETHEPTTTTIDTTSKNYFFVKSSGKLIKVNFNEINYVEGMKDYLKIHTSSQTIVTHQTMKAMEELLPTNLFMRVHKSYIIAINSIKTIDGSSIFLDINKTEIPLGSSYKDALMDIINKKLVELKPYQRN